MSEEITQKQANETIEQRKKRFEIGINITNNRLEILEALERSEGVIFFFGHGTKESQMEEFPKILGSNVETEDTQYIAKLDEIITQLHDADRHITQTRQNTVRLGTETRSMLNDLRKQLG